MKRLRRFDLPSADLDHAMIRVGDSAQLSVRFTEHCKLDKPTEVGDHCNATGHSVSMDNLRVLDREQYWMKRKVTEASHIKQRAPPMNRDQGYQLPPIYGQIIPRPPPPQPNHPP